MENFKIKEGKIIPDPLNFLGVISMGNFCPYSPKIIIKNEEKIATNGDLVVVIENVGSQIVEKTFLFDGDKWNRVTFEIVPFSTPAYKE